MHLLRRAITGSFSMQAAFHRGIALVALASVSVACTALSGLNDLVVDPPVAADATTDLGDAPAEVGVDASAPEIATEAGFDADGSVGPVDAGTDLGTLDAAPIDSATDTYVSPDTATSEGGADAGPAETGPVVCPTGPGPAMVNAGAYCIDSTEVTQAHYAKFVAAKAGDTSGQPAFCAWNTSYAPGLSGGANDPVAKVDWCDAYMFCKWAGKRLCGSTKGGAATTLVANSPESQWYWACSAEDTRTYPYGWVYASSACRGADHVPPGLGAVATTPDCVGGLDGLYDMSGNVEEWEDACSGAGGATDRCLVRGGHAASIAAELSCDALVTRERGAPGDRTGFRCCTN